MDSPGGYGSHTGSFKTTQMRTSTLVLLGLQTPPTTTTSSSCPESTECAEKVEAMLSTAVLHLADLWNMLALEFSEGVAFDPDTALLTPVTEIPPVVLAAMKSKLENSLEWCQLARNRLRDITKLNPSSPPPSLQQVVAYPATTTTAHHQQNPSQQPGSCNHNLWQNRTSMGTSEMKLQANQFASPSPRSRMCTTVQNV